ncbi:MAG: YvcK family protein [Oscillospiraceae bacterium]|nr:YvcK family protein [Oscillospiraceae bacterium]
MDSEASRGSGIRIAVIGGGTGLSAMLRGLKLCTENITAIVTTADDGGGSGVLRQDMGIIPPGDIRNCILALANTEPAMEKLLDYRFTDGRLAGQSFGNLFLAALYGLSGSFDQAILHLSDVLAVAGRVLPVSCQPTSLEAVFENGTHVFGESSISEFKKKQKCRIKQIKLHPQQPEANRDVLSAIEGADLIVLGPGSLYTSIIPNLLVDGIVDAMNNANALRIYLCNIMTQEGETEGYTCFDHARELARHANNRNLFDICIVNSTPVPKECIPRYAEENASPPLLDREMFISEGIDIRECPLLQIKNGKIRHHPIRLALALFSLFCEISPRDEVCRQADERLLLWLKEQIEQEERV